MHNNPFSPSFSIRPERFYGREAELGIIREALRNPDSPNRFLFVTGTRGCGKTSLLHQFAEIARNEMGWTAFETTYRDCFQVLLEFANERSGARKRVSVKPSISVAGISASGLEIEHEKAAPNEPLLAQAFAAKAAKESRRGGVLVIIDEVQKIAEDDMEEISHAIQAAKSGGANVALVIAGLPLAYSKIRRYPGSTFVQRMRRLRLGMLSVADTRGFLKTSFALVPEIDLAPNLIEEMAEFSGGHPYLLQLVGGYAYELASAYAMPQAGSVVVLNAGNIREAERMALSDYQENVLRNLLVGLRGGSKEYLKAMCDVSDEQSTARTSDIAQALGKTTQECSSQRARIIDLQLAAPVGHGLLRFTLPYLPLAFDAPDIDCSPGEDAWIPRKYPMGLA